MRTQREVLGKILHAEARAALDAVGRGDYAPLNRMRERVVELMRRRKLADGRGRAPRSPRTRGQDLGGDARPGPREAPGQLREVGRLAPRAGLTQGPLDARGPHHPSQDQSHLGSRGPAPPLGVPGGWTGDRGGSRGRSPRWRARARPCEATRPPWQGVEKAGLRL